MFVRINHFVSTIQIQVDSTPGERQESSAEQLHPRAPVHLSSERLQAVDVPFHRAIALALGDVGTWSNSQSRPENKFETDRGSYLQRLAGVLRSRHLRWQPAHAALSVSAMSIIMS